MSALLNKKWEYVLDQAAQVLNLKDNEDLNFFKTIYMYDVFGEILKDSSSKEFSSSLKRSLNCHSNRNLIFNKELNELIKNDPNSFLISPLASSTHFFNVLIRSTDEGFSATVINRGIRNSASPYMEYLFNDVNKLHTVLVANHFYSDDTNKSINDVYKSFRQNSTPESRPMRLSVFSKTQKKGNCVVKEPESAIKFAYVTRNFENDELKMLRQKGREFHPKWAPSTIQIHQKYINTLKNRHFELKDKLNELWSQYIKKKTKPPRLSRDYRNERLVKLVPKDSKLASNMDLDKKRAFNKIDVNDKTDNVLQKLSKRQKRGNSNEMTLGV